MKIAHVVGNFGLSPTPEEQGISGVVRAALEIARTQAATGHEVTVVSVGREPWKADWEGVKLVQLRAAPWARVRFGGRPLDFSLHVPLVGFTHRGNFDIVQGHLYYYLRLLRARARVAHFHADPFYKASAESKSETVRADFQVIAKSSDAQVAVSRFIARQIDKGMALCEKQANVHTVYNGVVHQRFSADAVARGGAALRRDLRVPEDAVVFLFVGAIVPEKGVIHLSKAFRELADQDPRVQLMVAGSASLWKKTVGQDVAEDYERTVANSLLPLVEQGRVHLLGRVNGSAIPNVYAASNVVVIPSIWSEAFGLVALEALAAGKPVIASDVGGLPEVVGTGSGLLVTPGDKASLLAAMRAFTNPDVRRTYERTARASSKNFSWTSAALQLEQVYESLLVTRSSRHIRAY